MLTRANRTARLLTFVITLLTGVAVVARPARADVPFAELLPADTFLMVRIANVQELRERWGATQFGQLFADAAMKPFVDSVLKAMEEVGAEFQKQAGLSFTELLELPQGEMAVALRGPANEDEQTPRLLVLIDIATQQEKARELLDRLTVKLVDAGYERRQEEAQGTTLTVLTPSVEQQSDDWPPIAWGLRESIAMVATDLPTLADVLARWDGGAEETIARKPPYQRIVERTGQDAQLHFYFDVAGLISLVTKSLPVPPNAGPQLTEVLKLMGLDSLHALGGSVNLSPGEYDYVVKLLLHYETPPRGLVRVLHFRNSDLAPQVWVPPDVTSYLSINLSLGELYTVADEIVGTFQPGGFNDLAQAILAAQGIDLDIRRELVGPLADRFTTISDYAQPGDIESERNLVAIALNDSKTASATVAKLSALGGGAIKQRDFQGHTVWTIELPPGMFPGLADEEGEPESMQISLCVAVGELFVTGSADLLEKVLLHSASQRSGLAATANYRQVAQHFPAQSAGIYFSRWDEDIRATYTLIKDGTLADYLGQLTELAPEWFSELADALDGSNLPEFERIQRYFGDQGMHLTSDKDGLMLVQFGLRKPAP